MVNASNIPEKIPAVIAGTMTFLKALNGLTLNLELHPLNLDPSLLIWVLPIK